MAERVDWRQDPIVVIEKRLSPVLPTMLLALLTRDANGAAVGDTTHAAVEVIRTVQARLLDPHDVTLDPAAACALKDLATQLERAGAEVRDAAGDADDDVRRALAVRLMSELRPRLDDALDLLRAAFIQTVLDRQAHARALSRVAAREVSAISRQIYFISINASVEAARAGVAGRGFAVIGEQIRTLSQDAAAALDRMQDMGVAPR
ncbi:methyl-accepting chemotaxis protein [Jannaschia sp. S6380]|uniref:methyl-accepting chemotaxis protein n=1 Tax=Jannaschia sp. S6380 TaxID=2926408 RepID=UPI001FF12259|nr:methyl-accepting chemotaxis protein [Jannaschia sp. S6380]MCK0168349.1 methyl-accepting chemotaxis protein [Jannaschia sp. S6380]